MNSTRQPIRARVEFGAKIAALALMAFFAYYPVLDAGFIWDDDGHFYEDKLMVEPGGLSRIWFAPDQTVWNYWPISRSSLWLDHRIWGFDAGASHAVNLVFHLAGVVILFLGLRRFGVPNAWFIAALFALHPVMVESVAWITERKNVVSVVFFLLSIWSYLAFDENRRWRLYGAALLLFLCCLLSKSSTVMLPVVLIIARTCLRKDWERRDFFLLAPFFLLSLVSAGGSIWFEEHVVGSRGMEFERSVGERIAVAGRIPFFYLQKIALPYPLIFLYPRWEMDGGSILHYVPFLALVGLGLVLWKCSSRAWGRGLFLGLGAFVVIQFPVLGFFDIYGMRYSFVADHWAYLPALPVLMLAGLGMNALLKDKRAIHLVARGVILVVCAVLTWSHVRAFESQEVLWRDTIAKDPNCWMAHNNLGYMLFQEGGREAEATGHYEEALRIRPNNPDANYNLGNAKVRQGRFEEAVPLFERMLSVQPLNAEGHNSLGVALLSMGKVDQAIVRFRRACELDPGHAVAKRNLGRVLSKQREGQ